MITNINDGEHRLAPMKFSQRINKYTLLPYHFKVFFDYGNLREMILQHRMRGMDELIEEFTPSIIPGGTGADIEALKRKQRTLLESNALLEIDEYLQGWHCSGHCHVWKYCSQQNLSLHMQHAGH